MTTFLKSFFCFTITDHKVADCGNFSWDDITKRTTNFSTQIASGGFSTVYLADSGFTAVKIQPTCTDRLARIHHQELEILVRLRHPNIVRFLGHSCDDKEQDQRALLFEYAPNGTLHQKLQPQYHLTWKTRTLIAFQLAQALEYLHGIQIIHGDVKASNILLDHHLNCKLCDFGSAKFGFTSMVLPPSSTKMNRIVMGSQGYVDPHYLSTGLVSKKNDVYGYGVILLELITGKEAFDFEKGEKLTESMSPVLNGAVGVEGVVDPRLRHDDGFHLDEVKAMLAVSGKCIHPSPMVRPCATQIVASMRNKFLSLAHL
ncbi:hypothetical protein R6Q59_019457 [Mikania micrantha]|uniref:Protein kinase domain-containing protein n=1 Tax=Mikania micrantha TaxID=192012 RepID=A0A5N6PV06_9ASTR|nr:hypothetical protein E3N88_07645 [Mikania micrantha]